MLQTIYRPGDLLNIPEPKKVSVGAGRKSMYVVNRSPFWFELRAAGGDPVAVIEAWEQTSFPIPIDTRTFVLTPYEMNGVPVVDYSSDLLNMVLVDTSCDAVSTSTHTPIISATVPLSVSATSPVGGSSSVSASSLVPFSGVPENVSIDPADNPWLEITGSDLLLQRATDIPISSKVTDVNGAYVNSAAAGSYFAMLLESEDFFNATEFNGGSSQTWNTWGAYIGNLPYTIAFGIPNASNIEGIGIIGANIPGGTLSGYKLSSPLGVQAKTLVGTVIVGGTNTNTTTIAETAPTSAEVMYFYVGQKIMLWTYVAPDGLSGYAGMYDVANPANGVAVSWTSSAAQTIGNPGVAEYYNNTGNGTAYLPFVGGTYDLVGAQVILTPSIGVLATTTLHGHSLSRLYVGSSPVSKLNPVPIERQTERLTQVLTTATLGASATYTQEWIDTQNPNLQDQYGNPGPSTIGSVAGELYTNEAGTLYVDTTDDTSNANLTVSASYACVASVETSIPRQNTTRRYVRFRFVNGATAQGSFELTQTAFTDETAMENGDIATTRVAGAALTANSASSTALNLPNGSLAYLRSLVVNTSAVGSADLVIYLTAASDAGAATPGANSPVTAYLMDLQATTRDTHELQDGKHSRPVSGTQFLNFWSSGTPSVSAVAVMGGEQ